MSEERLRGERDRSIRTASRLAMDVAERDNLIAEYKAEIEKLRAYANHERSLGAEGPMIELTTARQEIERLRAENAELRAVLPDLLDHYLNCYDGNMDALAHRARAALEEKQ